MCFADELSVYLRLACWGESFPDTSKKQYQQLVYNLPTVGSINGSGRGVRSENVPCGLRAKQQKDFFADFSDFSSIEKSSVHFFVAHLSMVDSLFLCSVESFSNHFVSG